MAFDDNIGLNDREIAFCMYYVGQAKFNGSKAAKLAGYSEKTAKEQASQLLTKLNVQKYIEELKKDLGKRIGITADMIALEYAKAGFSNVQDFISEGNNIDDLSGIDRDKAAAVSTIKTTVTDLGDLGTKTVTEFKLHDKLSALDKLARMIGADGILKVADVDEHGNAVKKQVIELPNGAIIPIG